METNTGNPTGNPVVKGFDELPEGLASDEFDRFMNLTGKLVQVPKTELDDKRREESASAG